MELSLFPFEIINWDEVPMEVHQGDHGHAEWRVRNLGNVRVRLVKYSPGYVANHWCSKGHIIHCVEGEMVTRLADGRLMKLNTGDTYMVGDNSNDHQSSSETGCTLFVVD